MKKGIMKATVLHALPCAPPKDDLRQRERAASSPRPETDLHDEALVALVAQREARASAALEELFLRHAEPLRRFLARFTGRETEAEDLVQDAFIRMAEKAGSYRGEGSFRTWLFSLAINLGRTRMRRVALEEKVGEEMPHLKPDLVRPRPADDPTWRAEQGELRMHLDRAIFALADSERETFLLYWFGELTYAEISALTGVSISASKVRVHRALARLATLLEPFREI
ncbi:MAG: RNA polymerase sigma factor [Planctomycetes bacterium]|nr:RNA polymerase sigma factor [Planctomycetota bacterium]